MNASQLPSITSIFAARGLLRVAFAVAWQRVKASQADEQTRYLARAKDLPDLERRMRHWSHAERRAWLPPR